MQIGFWRERWSEGRIGFHQAGGNAQLRQYFNQFRQSWGDAEAGGKVLVPLCGKTPDLSWLAAQGYEVVGVEFVENAAVQFFEEAGVTPERSETLSKRCYRYQNVSIIVGDFFGVSPHDLGPFDLVYDRAALVAVEPARREAYVEQLARLLRPSGGLFLLTFEHDTGSGPPFSVDNTEALFAARFLLERQRQDDILAAEPRFRERGATYMNEVLWFGQRRV